MMMIDLKSVPVHVSPTGQLPAHPWSMSSLMKSQKFDGVVPFHHPGAELQQPCPEEEWLL